ncbi:MAG TPA: hypothetical protein VNW04_01015, partial [Puia sp.]|nr:hypothetical protein [Puia sp.]
MKKGIWLLLLIIGFTRLSAQNVVSFRFSFNPPSSSDFVAGWIPLSGDPSQAVITASDPTTGISISSVNTANWFPNGDVCA